MTPNAATALVMVLVGFGLASATYLLLERAGRAGIPALFARGVAWSGLLLLLANVSCPRPAEHTRPLVLLDHSLSMDAAGAHWRAVSDSAAASGDVLPFGDPAVTADSVPSAGRSLLLPSLSAVAASNRALVVMSDGELEDGRDIPADLLDRAAFVVFPRDSVPDLAITHLEGPDRVTLGDSIALSLDVRGFRLPADRSARVEASAAGRVLGSSAITVSPASVRRERLAFSSRQLGAGEHLLRIAIADSADEEPRTDVRLLLVAVTRTPGVVLVASPGDWDSRALFRALRSVAQLPVRGYVQLQPNEWRMMDDLAPVSAAAVADAARNADLLILKGKQGSFAAGSRAHGLWLWPSGENGEAVLPGDWYLQLANAAPMAGALLGAPVDSFAPAVSITPIQPAPGDWVLLEAQERRRGAARPVVTGRDEGSRRRVTVSADGLWRWAFRGGSSEDAYRAWVGATVSWLLGARDSARGIARPLRPVVERGRPIVFEWSAPGPRRDVAIAVTDSASTRTDTLRFDGSGRAELRLPPGDYRYRLGDVGSGRIAVEDYSSEFEPRGRTLTDRDARSASIPSRSAARDWLWLVGLIIAALGAEWVARRRLGLR